MSAANSNRNAVARRRAHRGWSQAELARRADIPRTTISAIEGDRLRVKRAVERVRGQLRTVDAEAAKVEREIARRFHPYWGSLLKEANEQSSFGDQVEEYACLYTSRVSNLLAYSPLQYFRSPRDLMPHEL